MALAAIERAGRKDRQAIVEAASGDPGLSIRGRSGAWSFDANGDTTVTTISGNTVHDGKFQFVKLLGR